MEEKENSLVVSNNNVLSTGLFGEDEKKVKKATSINLNDEEQVDMLLNGMQEVDYKLNDCVGQVIECVGAYLQEFLSDSFNEETGEQVTRKKHTVMLFDKNGKSYVTGSNSCYMSFADIVAIKGMPTEDNVIRFVPIKVDAKEKGHSYLKLRLAMKDEVK